MSCPHPNGKILLLNSYVDCDCKIKGPRWDGQSLRDPAPIEGLLKLENSYGVEVFNEEELVREVPEADWMGIFCREGNKVFGKFRNPSVQFQYTAFKGNPFVDMRKAAWMKSCWYRIQDFCDAALTRFEELCYGHHRYPLQTKALENDIWCCSTKGRHVDMECANYLRHTNVVQMVESLVQELGNIRNWCGHLPDKPEENLQLSQVVNCNGIRFRWTNTVDGMNVQMELEVGI